MKRDFLRDARNAIEKMKREYRHSFKFYHPEGICGQNECWAEVQILEAWIIELEAMRDREVSQL